MHLKTAVVALRGGDAPNFGAWKGAAGEKDGLIELDPLRSRVGSRTLDGFGLVGMPEILGAQEGFADLRKSQIDAGQRNQEQDRAQKEAHPLVKIP